MNNPTSKDEHVGALVSGYVDGELTQQQRQLVEVHCAQCELCRGELESIQAVRRQVGGSALSPLGEDTWRERSADGGARALQGLGWIILLLGLIAVGGGGVWLFLRDDSLGIWPRISIAGVYLGAVLLLLSVARQRWLERKTDKYKDVEI